MNKRRLILELSENIYLYDCVKMNQLFKKNHAFFFFFLIYYFFTCITQEAINAADEEWTQHKKLIDTSRHGFRKSMVPELPYFHVWFEPNAGYGHVIEDAGQWEEWFGRQVVASMLDLPPEVWRRPRRAEGGDVERRGRVFEKEFEKFDWTKLLLTTT